MHQPKVILIIMDGWGYSPIKKGNAIALADKPCFDKLWNYYPHTLLNASGEAVGLSWGTVGGSEVSHLCLGSGRIMYQDSPRIAKTIFSGEFYKNPVLLETLESAKKSKSSLHLIGLVSAGGVHSHIDHLYALLEILHKKGFKNPSFIHMFTDGRDTPPKSAGFYVDKLNHKIKELHLETKIASVIGRSFAMDRDSHWDRTFAAYNCLVDGKGETANSAKEAIFKAYHLGETDEFIKPTIIFGDQEENQGLISKLFQNKPKQQTREPVGLIKNNDAVIFFNFRPERMKQLVETFLFPQSNFPNKKLLKNLYVTTIVEYEKSLPVHVAIPPEKIENPLAKIISDQQMNQLHLAETEKYAHVTYYFNGGNPKPFKNEDWVIVPSPRVATYDKQPEMSASKITNKLFELLEKKNYAFVLINFANADLVGHTGNLKATTKAIEAIDKELNRLTKELPQTTFLITADHGNAERMMDPKTGEVETEHSIEPVPFMLVGPKYKKNKSNSTVPKPTGLLADIAPTILHILNIKQPKEMTGLSLHQEEYQN